MSNVTLYDNGEAIGVVAYTDNMDMWNGSNNQCGGTGLHAGIGKLKDGRFYVCNGSQWQGSVDSATVISEEDAKSFCLRNNADEYENIFGEKPELLSE